MTNGSALSWILEKEQAVVLERTPLTYTFAVLAPNVVAMCDHWPAGTAVAPMTTQLEPPLFMPR